MLKSQANNLKPVGIILNSKISIRKKSGLVFLYIFFAILDNHHVFVAVQVDSGIPGNFIPAEALCQRVSQTHQ